MKKSSLGKTMELGGEGGSSEGSGGSDNDGRSPRESAQRFGLGAGKGRRQTGARAMSFKASCEVNKNKMSREEYLSLKKVERLAQSAAARASIEQRKCNPKVSKMYGVLGLDPSSPPEAEGNNIYEAKSANSNTRNGSRAYGLGQKLFMSEAEGIEAKETYLELQYRH
jgi:hypothetical protein